MTTTRKERLAALAFSLKFVASQLASRLPSRAERGAVSGANGQPHQTIIPLKFHSTKPFPDAPQVAAVAPLKLAS